jgi:polar amino acid transport system substrate-binding protein
MPTLIRIIVLSLLSLLVASPGMAQKKGQVSYLILNTVKPLIITEPDNPMAGGIVTEIIRSVFEKSNYEIVPKVMPWKRMAIEIREGGDWLTYGFPDGFGPDLPHEFSKLPIFEFNHVAITLRENDFKIRQTSDVFGRKAILVENFHYPGLDAHLDKPLEGKGSGMIHSVRGFTPQGVLKMLRHKRGDVVFGYLARMLYHVESSGLSLDDIRIQDASQIIPSSSVYLAFSPKISPDVKKLINDGVARITTSGELSRILAKFSGPENLKK